MHEHVSCLSLQATPPTIGGKWADPRCLAILVLLVMSLRAWQLSHTEVASRDSISYVRIAWQLEHGPWREVMPSSPQHPGYPLAVLGMSLPVRHLIPDDLPRAWQVSAQLVSALASVLLLPPMFFLGRELFDRRIAFWACVLFQCLPTSGKVMGDGLSDTLFLLFACTGLWLACLALRRQSWPCFALTGLAGGLAYLTRPEGALILGATGVVLLGIQIRGRWRQSWRNVLIEGAALSLAALAVMTPYVLVIGGLTVKNTPNIMINKQRPDADWEDRIRPHDAPDDERRSHGTMTGSTLLALFLGPGDPIFDAAVANVKDVSDLQNVQIPTRSRYLWALKAFYYEFGKAFYYVVWLPALLGLWWRRDCFRRVPGVWVGLLVCVSLSGLLYLMSERMGYLSDRHLLLIVLCGSYWAAAGSIVLGEKLALGATRLWPRLAGRRWTEGRTWSLGLLLLLALAPLPRTLERLHSERKGFRDIGYWMAGHVKPGDYIEDPYCWAYFYAGRVFLEGVGGLEASHPSCFYVVLEHSTNKHPRLVSLRGAAEHVLMQRNARIFHSEEVQRGKEKVCLQVWEVPGPYRAAPLPGLAGQRN